jgi:hypothetical protein
MGPRLPTVRELLLFHTGAPLLVVQCCELCALLGRCCRQGQARVRLLSQHYHSPDLLIAHLAGIHAAVVGLSEGGDRSKCNKAGAGAQTRNMCKVKRNTTCL